MKHWLSVILFLVGVQICQAASVITATIAITNTAGTTNGQTITVNSDVRTWTNAVYSAGSQVLTQTNNTLAASALLNQVAVYPFTGLQLGQTAVTNLTLRGTNDQALAVTLSAGWGEVSYVTNTIGSAIVVTLPLSAAAITAVQVAAGEMTITDLYPTSNGTNFWLSFSTPEYRITVTNNVNLLLSTNWPSSTNSTRVAGIRFKGDTVDRGLTWNTNWILLGVTNTSFTIPSNKLARAAFMIDGLGESNIVFGWSVQQ